MLKERINIYFGLKKDKCHKGKFHQDKCCLEEYDFTGVYCKTSQKFGKIHLSHTDSHINTVVVQNTSLAAKGALAHRLQRRTAYKIQNGRQGAPKWPTGSGKVSTSRFFGILRNFR